MPASSKSLFSCLCGARKKHVTENPQRGLPQSETKLQNQQVPTCENKISPRNEQRNHREDLEVQALLQLQRVLGGLPGTWLPRVHAILSIITVFFDATELSFYGASGANKAGLPVCFVRLAREFGDSSEGIKDGKGAPMAGFEVWPATERTKLEDHGRTNDCKMPDDTSMQLTRRQACQRLMPAMLDRMLSSQAPVIQTLKSSSSERALNPSGSGLTKGRPEALMENSTAGSIKDVVALVPLSIGSRIAGALWIIQYGRPTVADRTVVVTQQTLGTATANTPDGNSTPLSHSSSVATVDTTADMAKGAALKSPPPCPALLSSSRALEQLSVSASMCLLGQEVPFLASLSDSLRQLSACSSMQQLVGALCDLLSGHMRERFLLEPRIFAALVPEATSTVGLMFNRQPPAAAHRSTSKVARGAGGGSGLEALTGPRPQSPRPAPIFGRESRSLGSRPISENVSPYLPQSTNVALTAAALTTGSGSLDRDGGISHRTVRGQGLPRVVALTQNDLAVLDASIGKGGGGSGGGGGGGSNAAASGSFMALRAKPFPLAQTLLRHALRKVPTVAVASSNTSSNSASGGRLGSQSGVGSRAWAEVVEDCVVHVQDPKKPSRDVLLLIANSGAAATASSSLWPGGGSGLASSGTIPLGGSVHSVSGSFTSGRRIVSSLVLLVLPAGDGKAMIGLYVAFPQTLPLHLLQRARCSMLEILEVLSPVVAHKLTTDLAVELETLATAAPGSYAVVEAPEVDDCTVVAATMDDGTVLQASETKILLQSPVDEPTVDRMVPMYSPIVQSFLYDSRSAAGGPNSSMAQGGGPNSALGATRSLNLMDTIASPHACDNTVGMNSLLSVRESALAASNVPNFMTAGCEGLTQSTVIHMEELDMVQSTMRAQMPLLVASMQNSISNARVEAALAAAAASLHKSGTSVSISRGATFGADHSELSQLELHNQLGHGGCAVVFKGTLGTLDCAIKLMEMPDVDGMDATSSSKGNKTFKWENDVSGGDGDGGNGNRSDGAGGGSDGEGLLDNDSLAARRALLRNAMELAAMTSISHPNIMQVYNTFSNVTLGRRNKADGTDHFYLTSVNGSTITHPDAPPICVAVVCEWCDKGCLGSALQKRTFPTVLPHFSAARRTTNHSLAGSGGGRQGRILDFKGILMTLLDVAMALRHLHQHNLVHRDVKPANVLLKSNMMDPRGFTAKLADFGFVTLLNQPGDEKSGGDPFTWAEETCGTVTHMGPECWQKPARLGASCDIFSFGILMWELTAGGSRPYPEVHPNNIARVVKRGVRPLFDDSVPSQYRFLAQRCWTAEPTSRPRSSELVTAISQMLSRI
ncbi:hypothetical protein Vafri_8891 [Volvox africanus]|uniref:Protein kinase domain-containing protein n=1 Tax=Volvox africanus TaxID=51714 RepID=A0A8J4EYE7_9CHLO|nr:hypothetical protein Vafri_8891 [Volvox africanus]